MKDGFNKGVQQQKAGKLRGKGFRSEVWMNEDKAADRQTPLKQLRTGS